MSLKPGNIVLVTLSGAIAVLVALLLTSCATGNSKTSNDKPPADAVVSGTLGFVRGAANPPLAAGTAKLTDTHDG